MKQKMLIVINTLGRAGAEKALVSLMKILDTDRFEVDFLAMVDRGDLYPDLPYYVNVLNKTPVVGTVTDAAGLAALSTQIIKRLITKGYIFKFAAQAAVNLREQIHRGWLQADKFFWEALSGTAPRFSKQYDIAIAYTEGAATYYVAEYVRAKKKISYIHVDYFRAGYMEKIDRKYYEKIDYVFCVSEDVKKGFNIIYPEYAHKTRMCHNIINADDIRRLAVTGKGFEDNFNGLRIVTIARLRPQKALHHSIRECVKLCESSDVNIRWYVLGDGKLRNGLQAQIDKCRLTDRFILYGTVENPFPYLLQADIYVQASNYEGWSLAIAEAMVLRKPIVVSDRANNPDQIVDGVNGIVVTMEEGSLADGLRSMIESKQRREEYVENLKDWDEEINRGINMIYQIADGEIPRESV